MVKAATENDILLSMMDKLVGENADLEPAQIAFDTTRGDFAARLTAAVEALFARLARHEVFIDVPEHPEELTKTELDALVRPASDGFLGSYPSKGELLEQARRIKRRQERRPAWVPRVDRDGNPLPSVSESVDAQERPALQPCVVTSFPELGDITIHLPTDYDDRPDLAVTPGGIGEWETVLHAALAVAGNEGPNVDLRIDAQANEALVPEGVRWWSPGPTQSGLSKPIPAAQDPGVASELVATSATLGGSPVIDNTSVGTEAVISALASAGDWRHSRRWVLDSWDPGDETGILATAQAAIAGWVDEGRSGLIVYVYGAALHGHDGLFAIPAPMHSFVLCVTRSATGADTVDTVHRLILSCPGDNWCRRGGCPEGSLSELDALLAPVVTVGEAAAAAIGDAGWAWEAYQRLYGAVDGDEYVGTVLECLEMIVSRASWVKLSDSMWEGGLQESPLRRGQYCLRAAYDPVTRQIRLSDGKPELELTLQSLAEDGMLTADDEGQERIDPSAETAQEWNRDLLTAAEDLLRGRIDALSLPDGPVQVAVLGLHPHADGSLRGPASTTLATEQLTVLLDAIGVLGDSE
jgi:hypothetical protein